MICAVTSRSQPAPASPVFWHQIVAGSLAGFAELTLGGNPLSVFIANQIAGNPSNVKASLSKGWLSHYYGQSYLYNLAFRVPFLSAIATGIYAADTQLRGYPDTHVPIQIGIRAMTASSFSLPFVLANDYLLANRANNNIDFKAMCKAGVGPLTQSFRRSLYATWVRETVFIAGPICSAKPLRDWVHPPSEHVSYWQTLGMTYMASAVTGSVAAVVSHPFHVIGITQQTQPAAQGLMKTGQEIIRKKGVNHLATAGLMPRLARMGLCSGIIVLSLDVFTRILEKRFP